MMRLFKLILSLALICVVVIGCGGSAVMSIRPMERTIDPSSIIYFSAETVLAEDVADEMTEFEAQVAAKLHETALFKGVFLGACTDSCENTLNVSGVVTDIHKVSGGQRFWAGAFAGKARLCVDLVICDAVSGDTLGFYAIEGKSGGTGYSGGTEAAIRRTAAEITELLQGHVSQ